MRRLLPLLVLLAAPLARGQGFFYKIDPPAPDATIRICAMTPIGPTTNPCFTPVPIFSDMALTIPARNPVSLGPDGAYAFWIAAGQYFLQYSGSTSTRTVVFSFGGNGAATNESYQHNGTLVGTQPTFNIIDSGTVTATVTNDSLNNRVNMTLAAAGGGSGITPCIAGRANAGTAAWVTEPAGSLIPNSPSWATRSGWLTTGSANGNTDVCDTLILALPGTSNDSPLVASSTTNNRVVVYWGANFGFHIATCQGLTGTGYTGFFPPDGSCISAVGDFTSFYSLTWSNADNAHGTSCADALGNGTSVPPSITCTDSSGRVISLSPNGPRVTPRLVSALPGCTEGLEVPITDSTTNTWGDVITGSGTFHVLAYCDGTNWTVAAK